MIEPVVDTLHVCRHVPPKYHDVLEPLARAITLQEIADELKWTHRMVEHAIHVIREALMLDEERVIWRVSYVRQFYGLDPCWCQDGR